MNYLLFIVLVILSWFNNLAYSEDVGLKVYDEQKLLATVNEVYDHYSQSHPACAYQSDPSITAYPEQHYRLVNPYTHAVNELISIDFTIRDFVLNSPVRHAEDPFCGEISIKCASYGSFLKSSAFHCERIHHGKGSDHALLADARYNQYLAYETIYYLFAMPTAQSHFGLMEQSDALDAFPHYSRSEHGNPQYEYHAVAYSTFSYPAPTGLPNYNNGRYGFLFLGSAENLKHMCKTIKNDHLSSYDAGVRFNQFLGIPPDSPDVTRTFTLFKLRNNPHVPGQADGNMFRPCPADGNIETPACSASAIFIPHDCSVPPPPYDGTTVNSFMENQYYSSYCNKTANIHSGIPILYPWTGEGFTYDWYPWQMSLTHVQGASEYIPAINSGSDNIEVVHQITLNDFLLTCDFE